MEKILYNAMFSRMQKEIKDSKSAIQKLEKIDSKYCKIKVEISKLLEIIEAYKNSELINKNKEITFICNGSPYIVLNLAMICITNNINAKINIDETMLGINKCLLKIINNILSENHLEVKIELTEEIEGNQLVFIDRINDFNIMKKQIANMKFIPYQSIDIYSDEIEFEELYETVYQYAIDMNIDVDIFEEEGIDTMLKYGKGKKKLILTSKEEIKNKYQNNNVYINENPFKNQETIFGKEIINEILS